MNLRLNRFAVVICAGVLGLAAPLAMSWGPEGHAIVADIAQSHLDPAAAAEVASLLKLEGLDRLDQIASWADGNRKEFPQTGGWHYVDIPLKAASYDAARDCAQGNCVVAKLDEYAHVLADKSATPQARLLALKWVVHLVGDIQQPLHAEDNDDKGGNTVQVQFFGKGTNLHSVWDGRVIEHALGLTLGPNYAIDRAAVQADAMTLDAAITPAQRAAWAPKGLLPQMGSVATGWAGESHLIAQQVAYVDIAKPSGDAWSERYQQKAWPVIQTRLEQGGVRLAEVLNEALAP
jgi:threonine dehydrogenase-like Zn-dependent dehydrogenase